MRTAARWRWVVAAAWGVLLGACGAGNKAQRAGEPPAPGSAWAARLTDRERGFEIARPSAEWSLEETEEVTQDGLAAPLVLRHKASGAQVVLQVAPALASPAQFAEKLSVGLAAQPGFLSEEPTPLPLAEGAVGFRFTLGDGVLGRVAVLEGGPDQVFMVMATWPAGAPDGIPRSVDAILASLKAVPRAGGTAAVGGAGVTPTSAPR